MVTFITRYVDNTQKNFIFVVFCSSSQLLDLLILFFALFFCPHSRTNTFYIPFVPQFGTLGFTSCTLYQDCICMYMCVCAYDFFVTRVKHLRVYRCGKYMSNVRLCYLRSLEWKIKMFFFLLRSLSFFLSLSLILLWLTSACEIKKKEKMECEWIVRANESFENGRTNHTILYTNRHWVLMTILFEVIESNPFSRMCE